MPKPTILVCQHLERISRKALEVHQDIIRNYVRKRHGVYALYRKDRLYYVGLARNLRNRLHTHLRDRHGKSWDRFSVYLTIGDSHIREMESLLLRIGRPSGNRVTGKFSKAENLIRRFKADIQRKQKVQLGELLGLPKAKLIQRVLSQNGKVPVLAPYVVKTLKLRAKFKGQTIRAHVMRSGTIAFKGKRYNSPSMAAAAACGRGACNGWTFWKFERGPHEWVSLSELRK